MKYSNTSPYVRQFEDTDKEILSLTKRIWEIFKEIEYEGFLKYDKNGELKPLISKPSYHMFGGNKHVEDGGVPMHVVPLESSRKILHDKLFQELIFTMQALDDIDKNYNPLSMLAKDKIFRGFDELIEDLPVCFELINDFDYKKRYVVVSVNFEHVNVKTEIYTFIMFIKKYRKREFNYLATMDTMQDKHLISRDKDYYKIGDLFKSKSDKKLMWKLFKAGTQQNMYSCKIDIWF